MSISINNIQDVSEYQLCCGCGICAFICPNKITIVDDLNYGRRPFINESQNDLTDDMEQALSVCPGINLIHEYNSANADLIHDLTENWGPIQEVLEGFSSEQTVRYLASSGGAISAISLFAIEKGNMHGVLNTSSRPDFPFLNHTVLSRTRKEVLAASGSRYAPASPCDGLQKIIDAPTPCVFVGKPCDVAAVQMLRKYRPDLDKKIGLTISIFCAGTPSTSGTLGLIKKLGVPNTGRLKSFRYRGNGWPGNAEASYEIKNGSDVKKTMTYDESWGYLSSHQQWRCHLCVDHTGEFADISVGDPWYRDIPKDDPGRSLVLIRTKNGKEFINKCINNGYINLEQVNPEVLAESQPNLLRTRGAVWGRIFALRIIGAPTPYSKGFPNFHIWLTTLSLSQKIKSIFGTIRRVMRRKLMSRHPIKQINIENKDKELII